jgi:hypothetical protein
MDETVVEQPQPEIILEEKPRRRGRKKEPPTEPVEVTVEEKPAPKKRAATRRASKLTGDDVSKGITLISQLVVLMTQQQHWYIPPEETRPWAGEAANLLNRIPPKWIQAATSASSIIVVTVGVYQTIMPRLLISKQLQEMPRNGRVEEPVYDA